MAPRTHAKPAFLTGRPRVQTQWVWGANERRRWAVFGAKLAIFLALPWIRVNGAPALGFDIPNRRYHAFGGVFWPQDLYMLGLLLALAAMLLFTTGSLVGRVFCGHACPQTLMTTLFMAIDHAIEGDRVARLKLDGAGGITPRRIGKHAAWLAIALVLGATFTSYFTGPFAGPFSGPVPTATTLAVTGLVYLFAGHLRDFVCTTVCPYGRFQGAMQDAASRLVAYDAARGEPRGKGPIAIARGGCIDCGLCVTACPMGIDIRNGPQYECITCARCVDACDATMIRIGAPTGLVRYAAADGPDAVAPWGRRAWYAAVIVTLVGALVTLVATRPLVGLAAARERTAAIALPDGAASNLYSLTLLNKDTRPHALTLGLADIRGRLVTGENPVTLAPGEIRRVRASVIARPGAGPVPFRFTADGGDLAAGAAATFVGVERISGR